MHSIPQASAAVERFNGKELRAGQKMTIRGVKANEIQTCEVSSDAIGRVKGKNCQVLNKIEKDHHTCIHISNKEVRM